MNRHELERLAAGLLGGQLSVEEFVGRFKAAQIADVGEAQIDLDRRRRCGFPEVVLAQGKTVGAMEKIFQAMLDSSGPDTNQQWSARDMLAFHLGLVRHGREICSARRPGCGICPLSDLCPRVGLGASKGPARKLE